MKIQCTVGRWDKPCKNPATYQFEHAPLGTVSPERQTERVCTRHARRIAKRIHFFIFIITKPIEPLKEAEK